MKKLTRNEILRGIVRGGALTGIAGLCVVLGRREEKFECSGRCGKCSELKDGQCSRGLK